MVVMSTSNAQPWTSIPRAQADIRLVACDMDGTLLGPDGRLPDDFGRTVQALRDRGITFVPASGRQYATLAAMFEPYAGEAGEASFSYIAENGTLVMHEGEVASTTTLDRDAVQRGVTVAHHAWQHLDGGLVVCGVRSAYVQRNDERFLTECDKYYRRLEVVEDLAQVEDDILKLAYFTFEDSEPIARDFLADFGDAYEVVVSGAHWVDLMSGEADKGRALTALQAALGVTPAQTAAFGDYLNDAQMLDAAEWSFAMAGAHPDILARARYHAPGNDENGVTEVLRRLLTE